MYGGELKTLTIEPTPWNLDESVCSADMDFVDMIANTRIRKVDNIFHMGPGNHHIVGRSLLSTHVTAITHCPAEMESYVKLAIAQPELTKTYQCMFGDIHMLSPYQLHNYYDVATLFHLGELTSGEYGAQMDTEVVKMFCNLARYVVLYKESFAYEIPASAMQTHFATYMGTYKSLVVYRGLI